MQLKQGCNGMFIAAVVAVIDQISKSAVRLMSGGSERITSYVPALWELPGVFAIRETHNTGVAFSMFSNSGLLLIVGTALLIALLTGWLIAKSAQQPRWMRVGLWMIVGGGLGNLYDRIAYGAVTDFIELLFIRFAVFNLADVAICSGAFIAAIAILADERRKESRP